MLLLLLRTEAPAAPSNSTTGIAAIQAVIICAGN